MSFSNYKNLGNILKKFQLSYYEQDFIVPVDIAINQSLQAELQFVLEELVTTNSESAICENLIYLIL